MPFYPNKLAKFCEDVLDLVAAFNWDFYVSLRNKYGIEFHSFCQNIETLEMDSKTEAKYSTPMVLIGIYISIASLFCVLAMALDLLNGFRNRKFWFPTKYFSLNAASITVITVAMKLPVDLSSPMPGALDQIAKIGSLAFMCTIMSNLMPSLASMDNNTLVANVTGLSIFIITIIANIFIQIRTHVIEHENFNFSEVTSPLVSRVASSMMLATCIYMGMLLFLLLILISSSITIPTSKKILESKYQITRINTTLNDQHSQENPTSTVDKLRQLVKRYWIMAETGSPQFVMASNPLSSASGVICALSMFLYIYLVFGRVMWGVNTWSELLKSKSVYKWSILPIVVTQSIGIVVGSIAPISRCFTLLSFKSFANQNKNHFLVLRVEKYWTKKLYEWKESGINFVSSGRRSRSLLHTLKNHILSFCIGFQKVTVVSCKILGLIPVVVIMFVNYLKALKGMLFTTSTPPNASSSNDYINDDLSRYVLLVEDNMQLAEKTTERISNSMNRLIQKAGKKQNKNLLKFLEKSVAFDGVEMFDSDQIQSLLSVEPMNSWSLPIVSLTSIAIALPSIHNDIVDNLLKSVDEGLLYTQIVEESLNKGPEYVNIRRATTTVWHEVEGTRKWLTNTLERSAHKGKKPIEIIKLFAHKAEENVKDNIMNNTNKEQMEKQNLPLKLIAANSMHRIAQTIMRRYESNTEVDEDELFAQLSCMIADILAACLTNIPQVITLRCHESAIEKREDSVVAAIKLLGRTTEIIKRLETRKLPNIDPDKMGFIDEWRFHLKQP